MSGVIFFIALPQNKIMTDQEFEEENGGESGFCLDCDASPCECHLYCRRFIPLLYIYRFYKRDPQIPDKHLYPEVISMTGLVGVTHKPMLLR